MGIAFALLALFSWGIGDFLIQRSARRFGDWIALFYITAFGTVGLLPFVWRDIPRVFESGGELPILAGSTIVLLFAAILDFEALRIGKISVMEAVYAFEVPVTLVLSRYFINERLSALETALILSLVVGTMLVSTRSFSINKKAVLEKGVWYAIFATLGMGAVNFLFGVGARETTPLLINWFTSACIAVISLAYLAVRGRASEITRYFRENAPLVTSVGVMDNLAWVAYAYSVTYIPIAIATGISESYIALAAGLGIFVNKERLKPRQFTGLALCVVAVVILSWITGA